MSYLDRLKDKIAETGVGGLPTEPTQPRSVSFVGAPGRPISESQARATLRHWHGRLRVLDPLVPPAAFDRARWETLRDDSWWIYENFASQAVREGWSALDLFGVLPFDHKLGGLVARLQGARNLKMSGQRATWSSWGVTDWTCASGGEGLASSGITLLWEFPC